MTLFYFVCMIVTGALILDYYFGPIFIIFIIIQIPRAATTGAFIAFRFDEKGARIKMLERVVTIILQILMYFVLIIMIPVDASTYSAETRTVTVGAYTSTVTNEDKVRGYYTWNIIGSYFLIFMDLALDIYIFFLLKKYFNSKRGTVPVKLQNGSNKGNFNSTNSKIIPNLENEEEKVI